MSLNGDHPIYSPYVGNTAASSSTTMIVPSLSPPSEKDDDEEDEAKEIIEKKPQTYTQPNIKQKQQLDYNDLQQPLECHPKHLYDHHANFKSPTATSIPIPAFSSTNSSYFPARSTASAPLPRFPYTPSSSSSSISYASSATASPKKRAKRWIMAALMVIVGLLIALTFILIGLGKAFSHHHDSQPHITTVTLTPSPTAINAMMTLSSTSHLTVLVVPTTVTTTFPSPTL